MSSAAQPGGTIVALSSGRPPAAIAVIRTSGPQAHAVAERIAGPLPDVRQAAVRTVRDPDSGDRIDDLLVLRFDGPASATGEDIVEYQCHGGRAVVDRLLSLIAAQKGVRLAQLGEFTRRALANGRIDLTEAEGLADLLQAETESQRKAALLLAGGRLRRQTERWRDRLLDLSAQAEAAIDYVGDEEETAIDVAALASSARTIASEIAALLAQPRAEPLRDGIRVVVAGPPNAGKSSLVNALCGTDRAIVTEIAGTTRDTIEVPMVLGGTPFVLVDTAGLRRSDDRVEAIGIARAEDEAARADILLWLGDADAAPPHAQLVPLHAKCDLDSELDPHRLRVSSKSGEGLSRLVDELVEKAGHILPSEGQLALNARQAAELSDVARALGGSESADLLLVAESLRAALAAMDRLSGRAGIEEMLDRLFGRFCLGK